MSMSQIGLQLSCIIKVFPKYNNAPPNFEGVSIHEIFAEVGLRLAFLVGEQFCRFIL